MPNSVILCLYICVYTSICFCLFIIVPTSILTSAFVFVNVMTVSNPVNVSVSVFVKCGDLLSIVYRYVFVSLKV